MRSGDTAIAQRVLEVVLLGAIRLTISLILRGRRRWEFAATCDAPDAAQAFVLCPQPDRKEDDLTTERTENTEGMHGADRAVRHGVTASLDGSGRLSVSVSFRSFRGRSSSTMA
jgi:hypothetical protein